MNKVHTKTNLLAGLAIAIGLSLAGIAPLAAQSRIVERIIVKVNGDIFTQTDLEQKEIDALRDQKNRQVLNTLDLENDASLVALLKDITPDILVSSVDDLLLMQRGRELGYALSDENFKAAVERIKNAPENNIKSEEQWQAALKQQHLTMDELRRQMERQMLIGQAERDDVMAKLNLTEAEQRQYYEAHQAEFVKGANVTLREIQIGVPVTGRGALAGVNVAADNAAKAQIEALHDRALKGEDFTKLVAEASDAPSKANGGLIGPIELTNLNDALRTMIEGMKVGDVSAPLHSAKGYQLLKLESRAAAAPQPFEAVRDQIAEKFYLQRRDAEMKKYLDRLRSQAIIDWKDEGMKKMYETRLAAAKS